MGIHSMTVSVRTAAGSLAAARARGRRYALKQYENPGKLALLDARDYSGRYDHAVIELHQKGLRGRVGNESGK